MAISYEEFKNVLQTDLISYIGDKKDEYEIKFNKVKKINKDLDGFSIVKIDKSDESCSIAPTLYAEDFYSDYLKHEDIDRALREIAETFNYGLQMAQINAEPFLNMKEARDRIIFEVINKERNLELLKDLPHREFLDLAVVYRVVAGFDMHGLTSALVNNSILELMEITEEELYDLAYENTTELFPFEVKSMEEILLGIMEREGSFDAEICQKLSSIPEDRRLFVITNRLTFCAASALLYKDFLASIADEFDSDIYIIPVSVNELMFMKVTDSNPLPAVQEMVRRSNSLDEVLGEVLSNHVYQFSRKEGEIQIPHEVH